MMNAQGSISFVVGEDKKLTDVLSESEVMPLLKSVVGAGLDLAAVVDTAGEPLWFYAPGETGPGAMLPLGVSQETSLIKLSGETVGRIHLSAGTDIEPALLRFLARVIGDAFNSMAQTNLKRMMVTELHTRVVQMSYDELLEKNERLTESEQKYRELAQHLEVRVQERTTELKQAYARMLQQEKMASVGQLAAGMAHEINNPLSFVLSNMKTLEKYVGRLAELVNFYEDRLSDASCDEICGQLATRRDDLKIDFILDDLADLFFQSLAGAERVKKIVSDLRGFSHIDDAEHSQLDVNAEIERTLSVLSSEIPADAEIVREFAELPLSVCRGALLCQAFLNIIRNALQARPQGLQLQIRTALQQNGYIEIVFKDNGPGIAPDIQEHIFEPFFTTHEVGSGMGMGLKVAYDAVISCGGTIHVNSEEGQGASFVITLPVNGTCNE
jgi:two-component system, NtrC family, sensor kinase